MIRECAGHCGPTFNWCQVIESDLPEEQRHWVLANHFAGEPRECPKRMGRNGGVVAQAQYSELLAILRLRRDVEGQRRALGGILDAVGT